MMPSSWPIRVRLTVLYAASFVAAGAVLVTATYVLVSQSLIRPGATERLDAMSGRSGVSADALASARAAVDAYRTDTLNAVLTLSLVALGAALVLAIALGWALAGRVLRPLQQISDTARRVADRSLHERIGLSGPDDEVKGLADTIDAMLERLDRAFDAQRTFVANASHELRTPLAVNRTLLEVALGEPEVSDDLRRLGATILATNERSEKVVEGLLVQARSENALTERSPVDLADVTAVAIEHEAGAARAAGIEVDAQLAPAPVEGSGVLLERLALNLVQNVVRHAGPGVATVRTGTAGSSAFLEVESAGPVFSPSGVDVLFEPFRRGSGRIATNGPAGRGVGLGLSIVRSIARSHAGTVRGLPREGGGLVMRVELPLRVIADS
jgi:signal transduction histidine kinase